MGFCDIITETAYFDGYNTFKGAVQNETRYFTEGTKHENKKMDTTDPVYFGRYGRRPWLLLFGRLRYRQLRHHIKPHSFYALYGSDRLDAVWPVWEGV